MDEYRWMRRTLVFLACFCGYKSIQSGVFNGLGFAAILFCAGAIALYVERERNDRR